MLSIKGMHSNSEVSRHCVWQWTTCEANCCFVVVHISDHVTSFTFNEGRVHCGTSSITHCDLVSVFSYYQDFWKDFWNPCRFYLRSSVIVNGVQERNKGKILFNRQMFTWMHSAHGLQRKELQYSFARMLLNKQCTISS